MMLLAFVALTLLIASVLLWRFGIALVLFAPVHKVAFFTLSMLFVLSVIRYAARAPASSPRHND
jgi:hypothetical protein